MATKLGGNKPTRSNATIRTQTASWQYDSADYADGMDNKDHPSYKALPNGGNKHSGVQNPNKTFNEGRGPTKGNTGSLVQGPKHPVAPGVPDFKAAAKRAFAGTLNAGKQDRTPGGTRSFEPSCEENYKGDINSINFGRGPTKGNAQ